MAGGGDYRDRSQTQHEAAAVGYPMIAAAIAELGDRVDRAGRPDADAGPIVLADFGAASGNNSLRPMSIALDAFAAERALVVHTDLPGNDFATLFGVVDHDPGSYLVGRDDTFALVAGRSFYDRIFPASTLSFGWSASSLHWLSAAPGPVPDHFFVHLSGDAACREAYRQRSQQDWRRFLDHRATELRPGAGLVIVDVLRDEDGTMGSEALFDRLAAAIAAQRDAGVLTETEYADLVYPTWFRSVPDLSEPFDPVYASAAGAVLELVEVQRSVLADPFADLLSEGRVADYAREQTGFLRAFLEPSFTAQLAPSRDAASRAAVLAAIFTTTERSIAADPEAVSPAYRLSAIRIRRKT